jgi:hypothetical protein
MAAVPNTTAFLVFLPRHCVGAYFDLNAERMQYVDMMFWFSSKINVEFMRFTDSEPINGRRKSGSFVQENELLSAVLIMSLKRRFVFRMICNWRR